MANNGVRQRGLAFWNNTILPAVELPETFEQKKWRTYIETTKENVAAIMAEEKTDYNGAFRHYMWRIAYAPHPRHPFLPLTFAYHFLPVFKKFVAECIFPAEATTNIRSLPPINENELFSGTKDAKNRNDDGATAPSLSLKKQM